MTAASTPTRMLEIDQGDVIRDRFGRPKVCGSWCTRPTTIAGTLADRTYLDKIWNAGQVLKGVAADSVLLDRVRIWTSTDDSKELRSILDTAHERANSYGAAERGTMIHEATRLFDLGHDLSSLSTDVQASVQVWDGLLTKHSLTPLVAELTVANLNDLAVPTAGTLDRVCMGSRGAVVVDVKTSKASAADYDSTWIEFAIQLAIYANSQPVMHGDVTTWDAIDVPAPSREYAAVAHIPRDDLSAAAIYVIDIARGWELAHLAAEVKKARGSKGLARRL